MIYLHQPIQGFYYLTSKLFSGRDKHWYCCKWGWTLKLRLFASLYFCSGRRISIWLFVVNFNFIFSIGQWFRAGRYKISHLQQYLSVRQNLLSAHHLCLAGNQTPMIKFCLTTKVSLYKMGFGTLCYSHLLLKYRKLRLT